MRNEFSSPIRLARTGTSSATWSERSRERVLIRRISSCTAWGSSVSNALIWVSLIT